MLEYIEDEVLNKKFTQAEEPYGINSAGGISIEGPTGSLSGLSNVQEVVDFLDGLNLNSSGGSVNLIDHNVVGAYRTETATFDYPNDTITVPQVFYEELQNGDSIYISGGVSGSFHFIHKVDDVNFKITLHANRGEGISGANVVDLVSSGTFTFMVNLTSHIKTVDNGKDIYVLCAPVTVSAGKFFVLPLNPPDKFIFSGHTEATGSTPCTWYVNPGNPNIKFGVDGLPSEFTNSINTSSVRIISCKFYFKAGNTPGTGLWLPMFVTQDRDT